MFKLIFPDICDDIAYEKTSESDESIATQESVMNSPEKRVARHRKEAVPSTSGTETNRMVRKAKASKNDETDSDIDSSSGEDNNFHCFARVTRNGNAMMKIFNRINQIMKSDDEINVDGQLCVICYEKRKTLALLPCRHQHTCDACWSLWSIQSLSLSEESFEEDNDDATKPLCPLCKAPVDTTISLLN